MVFKKVSSQAFLINIPEKYTENGWQWNWPWLEWGVGSYPALKLTDPLVETLPLELRAWQSAREGEHRSLQDGTPLQDGKVGATVAKGPLLRFGVSIIGWSPSRGQSRHTEMVGQ